MIRRLTTPVLLVAFIGMASSGLMMLIVDLPSFTLRLHPVHKVFSIVLVLAVGLHLFTQAATLRRRLKDPAARCTAGLVMLLLVVCYALAWMNPVVPQQAQQLDEMARRIEAGEPWMADEAKLQTDPSQALNIELKYCDRYGAWR